MQDDCDDKVAVWVGWEIEGRDCYGTYECYDLNKLPPVTVLKQLEHMHTPADIPANLKKIIESISVASCYFKSTNPEMGDFFHDQQDCAVWCFDEQTGSVVIDDSKKLVTASSLPEFLSRLLIEHYCYTGLGQGHFGYLFEKLTSLTEEEKSLVASIADAAKVYLEYSKTHPYNRE